MKPSDVVGLAVSETHAAGFQSIMLHRDEPVEEVNRVQILQVVGGMKEARFPFLMGLLILC
jgi:hypothetical protein